MKVKIELEYADWQTLLELVFLGEYAVNACRSPKDISKRHADVAFSMYKKAYEWANRTADPETIEDNEVADIRDRLYDETQTYLEQFERDVCLEKLAQLLAEREYPDGGEYTEIKRTVAEELLIRKLQSEGLGFLQFDYPQLRQDVERELKR